MAPSRLSGGSANDDVAFKNKEMWWSDRRGRPRSKSGWIRLGEHGPGREGGERIDGLGKGFLAKLSGAMISSVGG